MKPNATAPAGETAVAPAEKLRPLLKAERVQERLRELPGWQRSAAGPGLLGYFYFPTIRAALAFVGFAVTVFRHFSVVPRLEISGGAVVVHVASYTTPGEVSEQDLEIAKRLSGGQGGRP